MPDVILLLPQEPGHPHAGTSSTKCLGLYQKIAVAKRLHNFLGVVPKTTNVKKSVASAEHLFRQGWHEVVRGGLCLAYIGSTNRRTARCDFNVLTEIICREAQPLLFILFVRICLYAHARAHVHRRLFGRDLRAGIKL